jgi:hypothetical protein
MMKTEAIDEDPVVATEIALGMAADHLERNLARYRNGGLPVVLQDLGLQAAIFQYEMCWETATHVRIDPQGFASKIAIKGLILKLYEYDKTLAFRIRQLSTFAKGCDIAFADATLKDEKRKWVKQAHVLRSWGTVRNYSIGHYHQDFDKQLAALQGIDTDEVADVAGAFLRFNLWFLLQIEAVQSEFCARMLEAPVGLSEFTR